VVHQFGEMSFCATPVVFVAVKNLFGNVSLELFEGIGSLPLLFRKFFVPRLLANLDIVVSIPRHAHHVHDRRVVCKVTHVTWGMHSIEEFFEVEALRT